MLIVAASMIGVGGLARDAGFSLAAATASTVLLWAGPGQALLFGAVIAKTAWPAIAVSISVSSIRFLPMCVSLLPLVRRPRTRLLTLIVAAHCVAVTVWAECLRRVPGVPENERLPFFFGFSFTCVAGSTAATALGFVALGQAPAPFAAGLLFLSPIYFTATIVRGSKQPADWLALVFGLLLSPVMAAVAPAGFDFLTLGLVAGTAAYLVQRGLDARAGR